MMSDKPLLTQIRLKELLHYDPDTGKWIRLTHAGSMRAGVEAGRGIDGAGYVRFRVDGKKYGGHQLAWLYMTGEWPSEEIDHKDTDRSNNRWENLRLATRSQNQHNRTVNKNTLSSRKGVGWYARLQRWRVRIVLNKKSIFLGYFDDLNDASNAYEIAAKKYHGEFARS